MADAWGGSWGSAWGYSWGVAHVSPSSSSTGGGGWSGGHRRVPLEEQQRELRFRSARESRKISRDDGDTRALEIAWAKVLGLEPDQPVGTDLSPADFAALARRLWDEKTAREQEELAIVMLLSL